MHVEDLIGGDQGRAGGQLLAEVIERGIGRQAQIGYL